MTGVSGSVDDLLTVLKVRRAECLQDLFSHQFTCSTSADIYESRTTDKKKSDLEPVGHEAGGSVHWGAPVSPLN